MAHHVVNREDYRYYIYSDMSGLACSNLEPHTSVLSAAKGIGVCQS